MIEYRYNPILNQMEYRSLVNMDFDFGVSWTRIDPSNIKEHWKELQWIDTWCDPIAEAHTYRSVTGSLFTQD